MKKACELTGKSRATVYRRRNGTRSGCRERRPAPPNALSAGERGELLAVLDGSRFRDKAPRQVWALLIDEGIYLASVSTMYRLLREAGQVRERRAQAAHPARKKPELIATGPSEVWSWDITKLAGPGRGVYYHLYVMIDIFSRCAVHFEVHATELGELAKDFMTEAIRLNGGVAPHAIHADRGTSMTSKTRAISRSLTAAARLRCAIARLGGRHPAAAMADSRINFPSVPVNGRWPSLFPELWLLPRNHIFRREGHPVPVSHSAPASQVVPARQGQATSKKRTSRAC